MSWKITGVGVAPQLLDLYSGAAAAYSLRSLSLAYGGPVVRVRRSSDNTEQDFTAAQVTDGTLTAFCGAGDGFVRTWYDQSGNGRNATPTTTANQPTVFTSGAVSSLSGLTGLSFNGSSTQLGVSLPANVTFGCFIVYRSNESAVKVVIRNEAFNSSGWLLTHSFGYRISSSGANSLISSSQVSSKNLYSLNYDGSTQSLHYNGSLVQSKAASFTSTTASTQIGSFGNSEFLNGIISEIIYYPTSQSSSRAGIESNINAHYSIY